jgi:hypothetical protein
MGAREAVCALAGPISCRIFFKITEVSCCYLIFGITLGFLR